MWLKRNTKSMLCLGEAPNITPQNAGAKLGPILVGMTGAFGTTGMAPRERKIKMSLVHASHQDGAWGRRRWMDSFVAPGKVAVFYTSGRPLRRKCTKGASPKP